MQPFITSGIAPLSTSDWSIMSAFIARQNAEWLEKKKKKDPEIAKRTIAGGSGAVEQLGYPVTAWVVQERTCCLSGINGARDVTFVKEGHTDTPLPL